MCLLHRVGLALLSRSSAFHLLWLERGILKAILCIAHLLAEGQTLNPSHFVVYWEQVLGVPRGASIS